MQFAILFWPSLEIKKFSSVGFVMNPSSTRILGILTWWRTQNMAWRTPLSRRLISTNSFWM